MKQCKDNAVGLKESLARFKAGKEIAFHAPTGEIARAFIRWCRNNDIEEGDREFDEGTKWEDEQSDTYYWLNGGLTTVEKHHLEHLQWEIVEISLKGILSQIVKKRRKGL